MELAFELRDEDFRVAQRAASKALQRLAAHWSVTWLGVLHWMTIGAFAMAVIEQVPRGARLPVLCLGLAMVASLWAVLLLQHRRLQARFRTDAGPLPRMQHVRLQDDGIVMTSATGRSDAAWPQLRDVLQPPGHVLLLFAQGVCLPIPDRAFPDTATREAFLAALAAHRTTA